MLYCDSVLEKSASTDVGKIWWPGAEKVGGNEWCSSAAVDAMSLDCTSCVQGGCFIITKEAENLMPVKTMSDCM